MGLPFVGGQSVSVLVLVRAIIVRLMESMGCGWEERRS